MQDATSDKLDSATAKEVQELTLWCQRLATMVHRCTQPQSMVEDMQDMLQQQNLRIEALESAMSEHFEKIMGRVDQLEDDIGDAMAASSEESDEDDGSGVPNTLHHEQSGGIASVTSGDAGNLRAETSGDAGTPPNNNKKKKFKAHARFRKQGQTANLTQIQLEIAKLERQQSKEKYDMENEMNEQAEKLKRDLKKELDGMVLTRNESQAQLEMALANNRGVHHIFKRDGTFEYEVESSVWDSSMFIFFQFPKKDTDGKEMTIGNVTDKLALFITFCANMAMQLTLIMSIYLGMLNRKTNIDQDDLDQMVMYRERNEKIFLPGYDVSVADLLCERDLWSWEEDKYFDLYAYTRPSFSFWSEEIPGPCLAYLGMAVWVCSIFSDYDSMMMQFRGIIAIAHGPRSELALSEDGKRIKAHTVTRCHRTLMFLFILWPRLCINFGLLCVGLEYIAKTFAFSDIVLNCVALMFVLDMDEILHHVLLPKSIRKAIENFEPIKISRIRILHDVEVGDALRWLLIAICMTCAWHFSLKPHVIIFQGAVQRLCPDVEVTKVSLI
jgi:hypothetical protein